MRFEIYQISDIGKCNYAFRSWEEAKEEFTLKDYKKVYSAFCGNGKGNVDNSDVLEHLYHIFNCKHPKDFKGHSLSMSDVVILYDVDVKSIYYCDDFGWKNITENISHPNMMARSEMIEYLLYELNEEKENYLQGKENKYGYIFMLCNNMGIIPPNE